jgi:hypothetical protein
MCKYTTLTELSALYIDSLRLIDISKAVFSTRAMARESALILVNTPLDFQIKICIFLRPSDIRWHCARYVINQR